MTAVLPILLLAAALAILLPMAFLSVECAAALLPPRARGLPPDARSATIARCATNARRPTIAVLVPAHNEALVIRRMLESLAPQIMPRDRVVVIADNCSDATADIARQAGAVVLERRDPLLPGKSYALDFAVRALEKDRPEVFVVIDADCTVHPGALDAMAPLSFGGGRPVQASYTLELPAEPTPAERLAVLAFRIKNLVRPSGLDRLGLPCFLNGSGMAFPAAMIQSPVLASGRIAEDKWLTVDLVLAGHAPRFCPEARLTSPLPGRPRAQKSQSTRWLRGHLVCMRRQGPRLLLGAIRQRRADLLATLLELFVPPLSLLILLWLTILATSVAAGLCGLGWLPAIVAAGGGVTMAVSFGAVVRRFGEKSLPRTLWDVPPYIASRLPMYAAIALRPQKERTPTERDPVPPE
jgi:cellulose synthase/poly-beta-1,6-N-acetylglucosamine synthase-like glycosyltransferase